jgi:hypothetical protein
MSLVSGVVFANPTTSCWASASGGGNINPAFSNVSIVQGGSITMGSSINSNTPLDFSRDVSGTTFTEITMDYMNGASPSNLVLNVRDQNSDLDTMLFGEVRCAVLGSNYNSGDPYVSLGLSALNYNSGAGVTKPLMTFGPGTITTINEKELPQSGISVTSGSSNIVTLNYAYTDASYAVCVTPLTDTGAIMTAQPTSSNAFSVVSSGSNVNYSWITIPWTQ